MRPAVRYILAIATVLAAMGVPALIALYLVGQSESRWCATLELLTASPVPSPAHPAANPSRAGEYNFYTDLVTLRNQYGCPR